MARVELASDEELFVIKHKTNSTYGPAHVAVADFQDQLFEYGSARLEAGAQDVDLLFDGVNFSDVWTKQRILYGIDVKTGDYRKYVETQVS